MEQRRGESGGEATAKATPGSLEMDNEKLIPTKSKYIYSQSLECKVVYSQLGQYQTTF